MARMKHLQAEMKLGSWAASGGLFLGSLLVAGLVFPLAGCGNAEVDTLNISPTAQSVAVGSTAQFTATGTVGHGSNHPSTTQDETTLVSWSAAPSNVATVNSSGVATGVSAGTATITATIDGFTGILTATATLTVTAGGSGSPSGAGDITSISLIPGTQSVASPGGTAQFVPIGTTASGATINLSGLVQWSSSSQQIATVNGSGVVTGVSEGSTTITAIYTNSDSSVATGTATFQVVAGNSEQVTALTMFPSSQAATAQAQQSQFTVLGTENGLQYDVTDASQVAWTSSNLAVATVGTSGDGTPGLVTAVGAGTTSIIATYTNKDGSEVVAQGSYSVTIGAAQEPLLSINVVPSGVSVSNKGMTAQYLAFGTYSTTPTVRDLTNSVTWISLLPEVASINSGGAPGAPNSGGSSGELAGLATAQGYTGNTVIYAEATNPDGTVVLSNPQTFTCRDPDTNICDQAVPTPQFATITVFIEGENTSPTGEFVTAPSDTGTPDLIHCGPDWTGGGGQVCTGTYAVGSTVKLTENLPANSTYFGGWSSGSACAEAGSPADLSVLATSPTCTVTLNGNASVGVIFY